MLLRVIRVQSEHYHNYYESEFPIFYLANFLNIDKITKSYNGLQILFWKSQWATKCFYHKMLKKLFPFQVTLKNTNTNRNRNKFGLQNIKKKIKTPKYNRKTDHFPIYQ